MFIFYISNIKPFLIVELWRISIDESIHVMIKHGEVELTFSDHRTLEVPDKVTILTGFVVLVFQDIKKYYFAFRESKIISEFVFYSTIFKKSGCPQNVVHFQKR
jgi:hypothetical protein